MKRARAHLVLSVAFAAACAGESNANRPPSFIGAVPQVRFLGRVDAQDPSAARLSWSSSGVVARFRGTQIDARLRDPSGLNAFQIVVDGSPTMTLATSSHKETYTLAANLPDGEHEVMLIKRTEARVGEVQFLGFSQPLIVPLPAPARRIEFIGDSITAGYGNEGPNEHCRFTPQTENAFLTYASITARTLNAEHATVAWSGKTIDGMNELYDRAVATREDSRWDPRAWVPDVVVVNLGTNDVTRGDQQQPFVQSYVKLLDRVRAGYPKALLVCALGPMLTDIYPPGKQALTRARAYMHAAVQAKKKSGDERVVFVEFPAQDAANGYGCDYHPSVKTHQLMATQLASLLRAELGW